MVARDNFTDKVTSPTPFKTQKGRPVPDEPHIGSDVDVEPKPASRQTGTVRGGTTRPPKGESGEVVRTDGDEGGNAKSTKKG